jgi:hypothetical protein
MAENRTILATQPREPIHMPQLIIPDASGDTRMEFTADDDAAVSSCMAVFNDLRAKGYAAADVSDPDNKRTIKAFDRTATRIIMLPQLIGG